MNKMFILLFFTSYSLYSSHFLVKGASDWEKVVNGPENRIITSFSIPSTSHLTTEGLLLLYCHDHSKCVKKQKGLCSVFNPPSNNGNTELRVSLRPTFKFPTPKQLRKQGKRHGLLAEKGSLK
jgi:hypothetical protein